MSVQELSEEWQVSRTYIYQQKDQVLDYIRTLDGAAEGCPCVSLDDRFVKRAVISLALECHAPESGIQQFFGSVLGMHISIGRISSILHEASARALEFDNRISLEGISEGANDEIFQGNSPVLTGIDLSSTYIYLLEESGDRTADSWELFMSDRKDHGLELDVSISDAGTGLTAGIPRVFPEAAIQPDVFHELRPLGAEAARMERGAYKVIEKEAALERRAAGSRPQKRTLEQLDAVRPEAQKAVRDSDILSILFIWLVELLGFSGYSYEETLGLSEWVLSEMEAAFPERKKLTAQVKKFREKLPGTLSFLKRVKGRLAERAAERGIPPEAFELMYQERALPADSWEASRIEYRLGELLGREYTDAKQEFEAVLSRTNRASSMVENLNSRIRVYMNLKRTVPDSFFVLLKVYLNTRKYKRSRVKERIGKSPLELLTGKQWPEFLEILGY